MSGRNIILTGFMGTGKSTVGRLVAAALGRELVDMDAVLESRAGCTIAEIFRRQGEAHFRRLERALVVELAARSGLVIAAGGGVVLNPANLDDFRRSGLIICLAAAPESILRRVARATHRPLLAGDDPRARIDELLAARRAAYAAVPHQVDTTELTPAAVAERVLALARTQGA